MKHARKPIALILVLLLFLSLLPVGAFAADDAELTEEEEVVEVLPPEEETEAPAEEEEGIPEEEVLPPEDGEEEDVLPEETDDLEPMAEPEKEEDAEIEVQADLVYDEETGMYFTVTKEKATVTSYNSSVLPADLVIPETLGGYPVTAIGDNAFQYCYGLKSVTISEGVKEIGARAFYSDSSITTVSLPSTLETIGE